MFAHRFFPQRFFAPRYFEPPASFLATVPADPIVDTSETDFEETQRFPELISWGSRGGPSFKTEVTVMNSGHEQRNQLWSQPRCKYEAQWGVKTADQYTEIIGFFRSMKGKKRGFRFKDWTDFSSVVAQVSVPTITALDQPLGTGNGTTTTFQLKKVYSSGAGYTRNIVKPVAGTVRIAVDGTEVFSGWVVTTTGKVVFGIAPSNGAVLTAGFEFDVPCRFDTDDLDLTIDDFEQVSGTVPLMEVRYRLSPANVGDTNQTGYPQPPAFPTVQQNSCGSTLAEFDVTIDPAYNGNITIELGENSTGATLTNNVVVAGGGIATFSDLTISDPGTGYTLVTTVDGFGSAESNSFDIVWAENAVCGLSSSREVLTGLPSTARYGLFMIWYRGRAGCEFYLGPDLFNTGEPDRAFIVLRVSSGGFNLQKNDNSNSIIFQLSQLPNVADDTTWHQDIMSFDSVSKTFQYVRDGVDISSSVLPFQANGTGAGPFALDPSFGGRISGATISDALFAYSDTANFDLTNPTNLSMLRSGSNPVLVTSLPNFSIPVYLHGGVDTYRDNLGTGGAFDNIVGNPPHPATSTPW